jgi:cAMP-dependent protein kinase regulator
MGCSPSKQADKESVVPPREAAPKNTGIGPESSRKRRAGVSAQAITAQQMNDWKQPVHEKTEENRTWLRKVISTNSKLQVLFGHLDDIQLDNVIVSMFPREVLNGEKVIRQGENGDAFWIVESGMFDIYVNRKMSIVSETASLGDKVAKCESGACFGELALMYNAPRAATVVATSNGKLWGLDADSFKMMLVTAENIKKKKYESFLQRVSILSELNAYERASLSDVIDVAKFEPGEVIMRQGDQGNNFYILLSGEAKAFISTENQPEVLAKHYSSPGEYFGELALILASPRKATVYAADGGCVLLYIGKDKFDRVLGPIKHRLKVENYPQYADIIEAAKAQKDDELTLDEEEASPVSTGQ